MSKQKPYYQSVAGYNHDMLKKFSQAAKYEMAKHALLNKDYPAFTAIIRASDYVDGGLLSIAIRYLDVEAVKAIAAHTKTLTKGTDFTYHFKSIFEVDLFQKSKLTHQELKSRQQELFKLVLGMKHADDINPEDARILSHFVTQQEFDAFCAQKSLPTTSADFIHYTLENATPLLSLSGYSHASTVDILLSRTYSTDMDITALRAIYEELYQLDPLAKEILSYMALVITQGNSVRIQFAQGEAPCYIPGQNVILMNTEPMDALSTVASVAIHEFGHFYYDTLLNEDASPIPMRPLQTAAAKFLSDNEALVDNPYGASTFEMKIDIEFMQAAIASEGPAYFGYEKAAKQPIIKAAELIGFDPKELDPYQLTEDYVQYFKDHSYITLFHLNFSAGHGPVSQSPEPDYILKTLMDLYIAEGSPALSSPFLTAESLTDWATGTLLPQVVAKYSLTPAQIFFLARIADYTIRGEHMFDQSWNPHSYEEESDERQIELIVRYLELKACPGMEADLIASFKPLADYHQQYVSPHFTETALEHKHDCGNMTAMPVYWDWNITQSQYTSTWHQDPLCVVEIVNS